MVKHTNDVFVLNGYVYWRYIWSKYTVSPNVIEETFSDGFWKIDYKKNIKVDITSTVFYDARKELKQIENNPKFIDTLFNEMLENTWLTKILYQSEIMIFGQ